MSIFARANWLVMATAIAVCFTAQTSIAHATSGPGCFRIVNVAPDDVLNIRIDPNFKSRLAGTMDPQHHGIINLTGTCTPLDREPGARWCPIRHFTGGGTTQGWVKRRFLADIHCP